MEYIKTPHLPNCAVSGVLVDYRTPASVITNLEKLNINLFRTKRCPHLYNAVDGHADMAFVHIADNIFICEPGCYEYYKQMFPRFNIICGKTHLTDTYPQDIAYNIARVGGIAFHNIKFTDKIILEYFNRYNIKLINVKQGYSKCSVCIVDENSIITADRSIADQAEKNNLDVLLINQGYINLPGLEYGFIGGCTGKLDKDKLAVCGSLKFHPDYQKITSFCKAKNVELIELSYAAPVDIGTIIPLYY